MIEKLIQKINDFKGLLANVLITEILLGAVVIITLIIIATGIEIVKHFL